MIATDSPMSINADDAPDLGTPRLNQWYRLIIAVDDARIALHEAQIGGDIGAIEHARLDLDARHAELLRFRQGVVDDLFMVLRFAQALHPGRFTELISESTRRELTLTQDAVIDAERRLDEIEDVIVETLRRRP